MQQKQYSQATLHDTFAGIVVEWDLTVKRKKYPETE